MSQRKSRPAEEERQDGQRFTKGRGTEDQSTAFGQLPVARCTAYEPAAARTRILVVVAECPYCGQPHQHFGPDLANLLDGVRSGCGHPYRLRLTQLVGGAHA